jgi:hypothetical protein
MTINQAILTLLAGVWGSSLAQAQSELEDVRVETYYISDANDATDTDGGGLEAGSRTYRVFLDLGPGCTLLGLFADTNHLFTVESTAPFFNNADRGKTYGHEIADNRLDENTVALDSWLSLGGASNLRYGVEKTLDPDGSILGGANNDGGSASVPGGLLINQDPAAGLPLTAQDGLVPLNGGVLPPVGFYRLGDDPSVVFDITTAGSVFTSADFVMGSGNPGVSGQGEQNVVLVGQFTTTGELSFAMNVIVGRPDGTVARFVANDSILLPGEQLFSLLNYPPTCGCTDPDYLEFDPNAGCELPGACITEIIFGCTDEAACNFDPTANFNVSVLCCYGPDNCNGLNINLVCPGVGLNEEFAQTDLVLFPNPVEDRMRLRFPERFGGVAHVFITDAAGRCVRTWADLPTSAGELELYTDRLPAGTYQVVLTGNAITLMQRFVVLP